MSVSFFSPFWPVHRLRLLSTEFIAFVIFPQTLPSFQERLSCSSTGFPESLVFSEVGDVSRETSPWYLALPDQLSEGFHLFSHDPVLFHFLFHDTY